jgi:Zinc finger, C3HC4 type (RING finger)
MATIAPSPSWECVICYENGATTGQLTLPCKHTVCLGCYTSMGSYGRSSTCPCCRATINTGERPPAPAPVRAPGYSQTLRVPAHAPGTDPRSLVIVHAPPPDPRAPDPRAPIVFSREEYDLMNNLTGRYSAFVVSLGGGGQIDRLTIMNAMTSRRAVTTTATATRAPIVFSREDYDLMQNIIERYYAFVRSLSGGGNIDLLTLINAMTDRLPVAPPT